MTAQTAFVALGANLGDAEDSVRTALGELARLPATQLVRQSSLFRTAPLDVAPGQPDYINAVAELHTGLSPEQLLQAMLDIEQAHGRQRPFRWAARTLDLDLLLYGDLVRNDPLLTLPHPRMHLRAFVLAPLAELAPDLLIPGRASVSEHLAEVVAQHIECL